jgi:hypothetical protein
VKCSTLVRLEGLVNAVALAAGDPAWPRRTGRWWCPSIDERNDLQEADIGLMREETGRHA